MNKKQPKIVPASPSFPTHAAMGEQIDQDNTQSSSGLDSKRMDSEEIMTPEEYERAKRINGPLI